MFNLATVIVIANYFIKFKVDKYLGWLCMLSLYIINYIAVYSKREKIVNDYTKKSTKIIIFNLLFWMYIIVSIFAFFIVINIFPYKWN